MTPQSIELAELAVVEAPTAAIRERKWVAWMLLLGDVAALEFALLLGCLLRLALLGWWPVRLHAAQFQGLALGVLFIPAGYQMAGLYPGYGLGPVEKLRAIRGFRGPRRLGLSRAARDVVARRAAGDRALRVGPATAG